MIDAQPAQAVLQLGDQPAARGALVVGVVAHRRPTPWSPARCRHGGRPADCSLADHLLGFAGGIPVGGVDEVDAGLERGIDDRGGVVLSGAAQRPKFIAPSDRVLTCTPVRPRVLYCMGCLHASDVASHASCGPVLPWCNRNGGSFSRYGTMFRSAGHAWHDEHQRTRPPLPHDGNAGPSSKDGRAAPRNRADADTSTGRAGAPQQTGRCPAQRADPARRRSGPLREFRCGGTGTRDRRQRRCRYRHHLPAFPHQGGPHHRGLPASG